MSSFAPIVKLRHHKVEAIQKELSLAQNYLIAKEAHKISLINELSDLMTPASGKVSEFIALKTQQQVFRDEIERCIVEINSAKNAIGVLRNQLKIAQIEFEKIDHLNKDYEAKRAVKIQKQENMVLEEAGINAHIFKNGATV